jgi:cytochrome b pre-mRNA-processing protein 3
MFALLKKQNPYAQAAKDAYARLLQQARQATFYSDYGVPDSFDGRFDLLVLHVFLLVNRAQKDGAAGKDFNQALFDATFADMDQTLREMGIGDMGVPKHMRRMMRGFNGRVHAYANALENDAALGEALARKLYGTAIGTDAGKIEKMKTYVRARAAALETATFDDILNGKI